MRRVIIAVSIWLGVVQPLTAAEFKEEFNAGKLDTCMWDLSQADYPRLFGFDEEPATHRRFLVALIDADRENADFPEIGVRQCPPEIDDQILADVDVPAPLGPSLVAPKPPKDPGSADACAIAEQRNGKAVVQRNELRFRDRARYGHRIDDPHWYQIRFRMKGDIPSCGSARWVTAQWKYGDSDWPYQGRFDQSPFLAQRFDNGVLHVTVQNGQCRCVVAKSAGDPDVGAPGMFAAAMFPSLRSLTLKEVEPLSCAWTGDRTGSCEPDNTFHVFAATTPEPPLLPDPKAGWVDMMYRVKASNVGDGEIDIYANDRFIVRVKGLIGYRGGKPGLVKFKFGHYRDKIPGVTELEIDRLCLSPSVAYCDEDLRPIP